MNSLHTSTGVFPPRSFSLIIHPLARASSRVSSPPPSPFSLRRFLHPSSLPYPSCRTIANPRSSGTGVGCCCPPLLSSLLRSASLLPYPLAPFAVAFTSGVATMAPPPLTFLVTTLAASRRSDASCTDDRRLIGLLRSPSLLVPNLMASKRADASCADTWSSMGEASCCAATWCPMGEVSCAIC